MEVKEIPFILKKHMQEDQKCIIPTLCEKVTLFNKIEDMTEPITSSEKYLIRFLDHRTQLPLAELYDPDLLDEEDLTLEAIEILAEETSNDELSWNEYYKKYPLETSRQFLSSSHYSSCLKVFNDLQKGHQPEIQKPLLNYFSDDDRKLLKEKRIKQYDPKLDKIKKVTSRAKFSTSFFKWYSDDEEVTVNDITDIIPKIEVLRLNGNHTGFAFGSIIENAGIIETSSNNSKEMRHINFWKFRTSCEYVEIIQSFSFYDLN